MFRLDSPLLFRSLNVIEETDMKMLLTSTLIGVVAASGCGAAPLDPSATGEVQQHPPEQLDA